MFKAASVLSLVLVLAAPFTADASVVTLSSAGTNYLEVYFSVPVQPAQHNALTIFPTTAGGPASPPFAATASLYDGATLLSSSTTTFVGQRYATPGSNFSATDPLIDYTTIANGSIVGLFTLLVTSGSVTFDTNNLVVQPFGDSGSLPGYAGTITGVSVSAVPLPAAAWLFLSGLGGLGAFARRKRVEAAGAVEA